MLYVVEIHKASLVDFKYRTLGKFLICVSIRFFLDIRINTFSVGVTFDVCEKNKYLQQIKCT